MNKTNYAYPEDFKQRAQAAFGLCLESDIVKIRRDFEAGHDFTHRLHDFVLGERTHLETNHLQTLIEGEEVAPGDFRRVVKHLRQINALEAVMKEFDDNAAKWRITPHAFGERGPQTGIVHMPQTAE